MISSTPPVEAVAERTMRKIRWRVLPLVLVIMVVAMLDRANVAYAKLTMSADLGFSEAVYGFGAGVFFLGYLFLEIPGALIVENWGGRRWFTRILISWGICAFLVGLIKTPTQFYITRFMLGLAEAGCFPGLIVHINHWFPQKYRAGALAKLVVSSPVALLLGGPISGWILKFNWLGTPGWRWVFILEAVPALVMGLVTLLVMTDRPQQAAWLEPDEREWVCKELETERQKKATVRKITIWQALHQRNVVLLALMTCLANSGIAGFYLWLPSTIHRASGLPPYLSAVLSGLPFALGVASQLTFGWSSDRTGERYLHTAVPLILAALIFPITTLPNLSLGWLLFWLCASWCAIVGFGPSFWVLPTVTLGESAGAAAIGFINIFSGVGGFIGPTVVGKLLTAGFSFSTTVYLLSLAFLATGLLTFTLQRHPSENLSTSNTS